MPENEYFKRKSAVPLRTQHPNQKRYSVETTRPKPNTSFPQNESAVPPHLHHRRLARENFTKGTVGLVPARRQLGCVRGAAYPGCPSVSGNGQTRAGGAGHSTGGSAATALAPAEPHAAAHGRTAAPTRTLSEPAPARAATQGAAAEQTQLETGSSIDTTTHLDQIKARQVELVFDNVGAVDLEEEAALAETSGAARVHVRVQGIVLAIRQGLD